MDHSGERYQHPSDDIPNEAYPDSSYVPGQGHLQRQSPQPLLLHQSSYQSQIGVPNASPNSLGYEYYPYGSHHSSLRTEGYQPVNNGGPVPAHVPLPSSPPPPYDPSSSPSAQVPMNGFATSSSSTLSSSGHLHGARDFYGRDQTFRPQQQQFHNHHHPQYHQASTQQPYGSTDSSLCLPGPLPGPPPPSPLEPLQPAHVSSQNHLPPAAGYPSSPYSFYENRPPLEQVEILEPSDRLTKIDPHRALRRRSRTRRLCWSLIILTIVVLLALGVMVSLKLRHVVEFD